jgi:hypothetical protein
MRISLLLRSAVLLALSLAPVLAAQQFQAPTDEELKMTADPKAPGADAVYLYVEEIDNDPLHYQSHYVRIKVLTEKGKSLATVEIPYVSGNWKVRAIAGRTIHPDGTIYPLVVKPEDLLSEQTGKLQFKRKVFTLPDVEVGSILEYRFEFQYDDNEFTSPTWDIQKRYFVHKAHYEFTPFEDFRPNATSMASSRFLVDERGHVINSLMWWKRLPPGVDMKTDLSGHYIVDVTDVPPDPDEDWMPPIDSLLYKVFFYYKAASTPSEFWLDETKYWASQVDKFAEPTRAIKSAVEGLVAANDSDDLKAKKLYAAVQALDNTDFSRAKGASEMKQLKLKEAKRAEDTWGQKSGSSDDIAMLYLSMLRAAGLTAYAARVADRNRAIFDPSYMSVDQLDSTLVVLSTGGQQILLDPGEKMCPFGTVAWQHSDASGLGESAKGPSFVTTPSQQYLSNVTRRIGVLAIDEHGGVTGQIRIEMTGQAALRWRQEALENDDAEVKKHFDAELARIVPDGVEGHVDHFEGMDDPYADLVALVTVDGVLGTPAARRMVLPSFFFETRRDVPFVKEEDRQVAVDMRYADRVTDQITYRIPADMAVEGAPQDAQISWPSHALLVAKSLTQPGQITLAQTLTLGFALLKPDGYKDLRGFYQKVADTDQEQVVLKETAVAKGN